MIKKNDLIKAMHEGIKDAHEDFERLSGGRWINDTGLPKMEGFLVSKIFLAISKRMNDDETLVVELPFGYIEEWTGAEKRERPTEDMSKSRRVDIALFNKMGKPVHVIEVKQKWVSGNDQGRGGADIEKLGKLLHKAGPTGGGSLKSVYFCAHYQRTNQPYEGSVDKAEEYVRSLGIKEANVKVHRKVWPAEIRNGKEWRYGSLIIELSRKYNK